KVKNKAVSTYLFSEIELLNRAMQLCYFTMLGDTAAANKVEEHIMSVSLQQIDRVSKEILRKTNCSTLFYRKKSN
ncbi:MAG: insulinase family protein, partial [Thermonemataceae bacterium]|nr:insulinase family protein [Thermonemataceae bacterium]